jgi:hypothetical protein
MSHAGRDGSKEPVISHLLGVMVICASYILEI